MEILARAKPQPPLRHLHVPEAPPHLDAKVPKPVLQQKLKQCVECLVCQGTVCLLEAEELAPQSVRDLKFGTPEQHMHPGSKASSASGKRSVSEASHGEVKAMIFKRG